MFIRLKIASIILIASMGAGCSSVSCTQPRAVPLGPDALHGVGRVYFVPINTFPSDVLERLVAYYLEKYDLNISVLSAPRPEVVSRAFNEERGQYVAEEIVRVLGHATVAFEPDSTLIAFTEKDLYIRAYDWKYAFGYRSDRLAVVSSARMEDRFMGVWPIDGVQETRLRKMVTKYIGVLHYRLPMSSNCRSPLFSQILGPEDLDSMGEDL